MVINSGPLFRCPCLYVEWFTVEYICTFNNSFLHFTLKESIELFSHCRGILPFKINNWFVRIFRPTFLLFCFKILKCVLRDVKIWLHLVVPNLQCDHYYCKAWAVELPVCTTWLYLGGFSLYCILTSLQGPPYKIIAAQLR